MTEPRGPVHLDVPAEVAGAHAVPVATACRPGPLPPPDPRSLDEAARLLAGASRPVLIAGLQCRSVTDAQWLRALAEALPAPVLLTLRAKRSEERRVGKESRSRGSPHKERRRAE